MQITVRLYASLKEKAGKSELGVEASALGDAVKKIRQVLDGEPVQIMLNGRNTEALSENRKLRKNDLLEAFPPVGGG